MTALRLLGRPQVLDTRSGQWRDLSRKGAALLALLALDGPVARDSLAAQLWPDAGGAKPRTNLRGLLRDLKALCGTDLVQGADLLSLAPHLVHDLADGVPGPDLPAPLPALLGAQAFGELDTFSDWLEQARTRLRQTRRQQVQQLCDTHHQQGRWTQAVAAARWLIDDDPLDEDAHRRLMTLHHRCDDRGAALAAYARCRQQLLQGLGTEPSAPTRALATLIQAGLPLPQATGSPLPQALQAQRMAARDDVCAAVLQAWQRSQAVCVDGEPGIGKSRLLEHLSDAPGTVRVAAADGDGSAPYALLSRLLQALLAWARPVLPVPVRAELARLRPEFGPPATTPARTHRLADALRQALAAWQAAGLRRLLVDDLHWADAASLPLLLPALLHAAQQGTLQVAVAQRPQADTDPVGADWLRLPLSPLTVDGMVQLFQALPAPPPDPARWAAALAAQTAGNPMHLLEALRAARADGHWPAQPPHAPPAQQASLHTLLTARVARLQGQALQLARLAALAGPAFSATLATQVLAVAPLALADTWRQLEVDGVLQGEALAHDSLREPLVAGIPDALARQLHAAVAQALADGQVEPAEHARHWARAGVWPAAADTWQRAARRAAALDARQDALRLWDQAGDGHERAGHWEAAFDARVQAFDAALEVAPLEEAAARAQALAAMAATALQQADAALAQTRVALTAYGHANAVEPAKQALALAPRGDLRHQRAQLLLAAALAGSGRGDEAMPHLQAVQSDPTTAHDPRLQLDLHSTLGYVHSWASRSDAAAAAFRQALLQAEALDDGSEAAIVASNLAASLVRCGDFRGAHDAALQGLAWRGRIGDLGSVAGAMAQQVLSLLCLRLGRYVDAQAAIDRARAVLGPSSSRRLVAAFDTACALVWLELGHPERARALLDEAGPAPEGGVLPRLSVQLAVDLALGADPTPWLARAEAAHQAEPPLNRWTWTLRRASAAVDPPDVAAQACAQLAQTAAAAGVRAVHLAALSRQAQQLARAGRPVQAVEAWRQVLRAWPDFQPHELPMPELWADAAQALADAGCSDEHDLAVRQGHAWLCQVLDDQLPAQPADTRTRYLAQRPHRQLLAAAAALGLPLPDGALNPDTRPPPTPGEHHAHPVSPGHHRR